MLCLFVKVRRHSSCAVSPSDTQLYDHALCLLCWWCLFHYGWHDSRPIRTRSLSTQYAQLHGLPEPPFWKEDCKINVQNGFPSIVQNWIGGERWGRQKDRLYKSRTLSDDSLHVNYSHETVASSMNPAGPVITDHHLKSTTVFFPFRFLAHKRNHHFSKLTITRTETVSGFVTNTPQHISAKNVLRHYSPTKTETLIIHEHADINNYISERSKLDQVVMQWRLHLKALKAVFFRSYLWSSPKYIQWNLLDLKVVIFRSALF